MGNSWANGPRDEEHLKEHADSDMGIPRFFAVLLMILEYSRLGRPALLRPICDSRVLDRFIREARDTENAMSREQEEEVQSGLRLLTQAISTARTTVTNTGLQELIDTSYSNLYSIRQILKSLNIQEGGPSASVMPGEMWQVSSLAELFRVHTNFLRGKVRLLLSQAKACQKNGS
ncbi:erythropoietin isoform X2 [Lepisosteus oculatus]|uniref:erythropoietin isoform X2 n=1 Tax=Lepisosteus oculatus TaxID=7918 RepID=UPI00074053A1|nr:PREDICTED: erythropoietin isoform X2 [Lepisosteus oculatus]